MSGTDWAAYQRITDREFKRMSESLMAAKNELDKFVGALASPKEVERALAQAAKEARYTCRLNNLDKAAAKHHIEVELLTLVNDRGYVRFGVSKTVGKLVGKMMDGYESGYNRVQPQIEMAKKRYERANQAMNKCRYWDHDALEAFLRAYWGC
jgi:hypothetical protein